MTCIVALKHTHGVTVGSDRSAGDRNSTEKFALHRVGGEYLYLAFSGNERVDVLQHMLCVPLLTQWAHHAEPYDLMIRYVIPAYRARLHELGIAPERNTFSALVVLRGKVFCVSSGFYTSPLQNSLGCEAEGGGQSAALGSLRTQLLVGRASSPKDMVFFALSVASHIHPTSVRPPFDIVTLSSDGRSANACTLSDTGATLGTRVYYPAV